MKLSLNWIKDYVNIDEDILKDLPHQLTMSTAEVEEVEEKGKDVDGVVVGKIVSISSHPKSDKLKIINVDIGESVVQSVCGAPNIFEGMIIPFAKIGGTLPVIGAVKSTEVRGIESNGIACSYRDLGISDSHEGVIEISDVCKPGDDAKELFGIEDTIIDIDNKSLTHRPDLWGHYGFAREIAAITGAKLTSLDLTSESEMKSTDPKVTAKIYDEEKCMRYSVVGLDGVKIMPSPAKMQTRLAYVGMRPINSIVDLTNYVMLEIGQPMHAFDARTIGDRIDVMTMSQLLKSRGDSKKDSKFTTLDGIERDIPDNTLMICSDGKGVALAGIMGGENSEVSTDTSRILLESATFDSASIRKSAIAIGLRSEASMRFEKSLDTNFALEASQRFIYLLRSINPEVTIYSGLDDQNPRPTEPISIEVTSEYISRYIGHSISPKEIKNILVSLDFDLKELTSKDSKGVIEWEVTVPTFRATKDITMKVDLVEEVARIYGYDNIDYKPLKSAVIPTRENRQIKVVHKLREILAKKFNMKEIHTYAWYDKEWNKSIGHKDKENLMIINPGISKFDTLRREIIPNLLAAVAKNEGFFDNFSLFEVASVYHPTQDYKKKKVEGTGADSLRDEEKHLGVVVHWKGRAAEKEDEAINMLKESIDDICLSILNMSPEFSEIDHIDISYVHPIKKSYVDVDGKKIGYISIINPKVLSQFEQKANIAFMDINLTTLLELTPKTIKYKEPSKYPEVNLDFSILVPKSMQYKTLKEKLNNFKHRYLKTIEYKATYTGKGIDEDKKSITVSATLSSSEATLSSEDINDFSNAFITWLKNENMELR